MISFAALVSRHRWKLLLALVVAAALFAFWWRRRTAPGASRPYVYSAPGEIDRVLYAVRQARAWRSTTSGTLHGQPFETVQEVSCPYDSHTLTRIRQADGSYAPAAEFIETRSTYFAREAGAEWYATPRTGPGKCAGGPMAGPSPLLELLQRVQQGSGLLPAPPGRSGDSAGPCRNWLFFDSASSGGQPAGVLCIDPESHFPLALRMGALLVHYDNWNLPIIVTPPVARSPASP